MFIKKYFIPNFLSLSSILCGFIAIILASYNEIRFAGILIILGGIFDGLDGKVARALKAANNMGKEMDSLADLTTFGIATGFLLYQGSLYKFGPPLGILIAASIPICAAIRLARFNTKTKPTKMYFEGMPTTWAGISIAILQAFYIRFFPPSFFLTFVIITSFLMISKFRYYKANKAFFKRLSSLIVIITFLFTIFVINLQVAILIPIFWYTVSGIFFSIRIFPKKDNIETLKLKF